MKTKEAIQLKPGQKVIHRRYGAAEVKEVATGVNPNSLFGVVIHITNPEGRKLLAADCGFPIPDLMVDSPRNLKLN